MLKCGDLLCSANTKYSTYHRRRQKNWTNRGKDKIFKKI